jgi:hypothetical protein
MLVILYTVHITPFRRNICEDSEEVFRISHRCLAPYLGRKILAKKSEPFFNERFYREAGFQYFCKGMR